MDIRNYSTCLWPGLSELWWRGRLSALPLAIGFAFGLNALLVLKYFYPTWLDPMLVRSAWWVGVVAWVCWTIKSVKELPALIAPRTVTEQPDRFVEAQASYLRADWDSAEPLLLGILGIEPRDPPALLMLSGLYRHTGRLENAALLVDELRRLEVADHWQIEIDAEADRIVRDAELSDDSEPDDQEEPEQVAGDATEHESDEQMGDSPADLTAA